MNGLDVTDVRPPAANNRLRGGVLGTSDIVFMVMAAAAPMAVVVALMPIALAFGNGPGVPGTYLCAIGAMLLFAMGYVRIIPFVQNAGAFYAYVTASIGRVWGLAAAYVATFSYLALSCSTIAALAYFAESFFERVSGSAMHWSFWAFASIALISWLSYHRITLAAKVLGVALVAEIAIILWLDLAVVKDVGIGAFEVGNFQPTSVLAPGIGIAAIYAFSSMIGVEGTAIYQEEARHREITVPRATYVAVILVGLFYVFTAWCLVSSVGAARVSDVARADPGSFIVDLGRTHLGKWGATAISVLVLTSAFAAALALFNNATRYLYALARDGVLPQPLSRTHPRHRSPHVASLCLTMALIVVFVLTALAGLDPLLNVATALTGLGTVGLMTLLSMTALAIPIFFARRQSFSFPTTVAPAIGGVIIATATSLSFANYSALTGVDSGVINHLPYALLVVAILGAVQATWLHRHRPNLYSRIGSTRVDDAGGAKGTASAQSATDPATSLGAAANTFGP
jgi:amino acid transporter